MRPSGTSTSTTGLVSANGKATYRASFSSVGVFASRFSTSDRKSTRLNSSHDQISYAVFCLKKKKSRPLQAPHSPARAYTAALTRPGPRGEPAFAHAPQATQTAPLHPCLELARSAAMAAQLRLQRP